MDKIFHRPVSPWYIGQGFGKNEACIDIATVSKVIACDGFNPPAGYRSVYGPQGHTGIDVYATRGQGVFCSQKGVVSSIDTNPRTGLDVRIISEINGKKYRHFYEHLLGYQHEVGAVVETGELIGWADNTGFSAGDHLHFQVEEWVGYWKPIDPVPLMSDKFAVDVLLINHKLKYIKEQLAIIAEKVADLLRKRA
jgi:murein DD-endopeptidase MepM/ murein hydrolase activator NlpD